MPSKTNTAAAPKTANTNAKKGQTMTTTTATRKAESANDAPDFGQAHLHAALVCSPDYCTDKVLGALWPNFPWLGVFRAYADKTQESGVSYENATIFAGDLATVWQVDITEVFSRKSAPRADVPHYTLPSPAKMLQAGWTWDDEAGRRISAALRAKAAKAQAAPQTQTAKGNASKPAGTKAAAGVDKAKKPTTAAPAPAKGKKAPAAPAPKTTAKPAASSKPASKKGAAVVDKKALAAAVAHAAANANPNTHRKAGAGKPRVIDNAPKGKVIKIDSKAAAKAAAAAKAKKASKKSA